MRYNGRLDARAATQASRLRADGNSGKAIILWHPTRNRFNSSPAATCGCRPTRSVGRRNRKWNSSSPRPSPPPVLKLKRAHPYKDGRPPRFYCLPARGHGGFQRHRSAGAADCRRGRVAVFASRAGRADDASGPDSHRGQLVGHVARPGGNAQSQRLTHESRRRLFDTVERRFHRSIFHHAAPRMAYRPANAATI